MKTTNPSGTPDKWCVPLDDWKQAIFTVSRDNWNETGFKDKLTAAVESQLQKSLTFQGFGSKNIREFLKENFQRVAFAKILQVLSYVDQNAESSLQHNAWMPRTRGGGTNRPDAAAKAINAIIQCLGGDTIEEPWAETSLPGVLEGIPWGVEFESIEFFDDFGDYSDIKRFIGSLRRPVRYFCCLHTGEHFRDLVETLLSSEHVREIVIRPIGTKLMEDSNLLPEWFVTALATNLAIVHRKCGLDGADPFTCKSNKCEVRIVPFAGLSPQMGAVITSTESKYKRKGETQLTTDTESTFGNLRGVIYSGEWQIKASSTFDSSSLLLGPGKLLPTFRAGFSGQEIRATSPTKLAVPFGNIADEFEMKRFARSKAQQIWLSEDQTKNGLSLQSYINAILKHEKVLSQWGKQRKRRSPKIRSN